MANFARRRETCRLVRGVIRAGVILLMARVAQRAIQRVIVVDVAIGAGARWHYVRSGQLETSAGVVESAIGPLHSVMASLACCGECHGDVVNWRNRIFVIGLMARVACRARQVVVIVGVAVRALAGRNGMRAGQRKTSAVVIEGGVQPRTGVVALIAALREVRADMVRIRCSLVFLEMAANTSIGGQVVIVVDMAIGALPGRHCMHPGQREIGHVVVERSVRP